MYSCDANYANCKYKEIVSLAFGYGQYDWKYYIPQNGSYVFQKESIIAKRSPDRRRPVYLVLIVIDETNRVAL
jgi:hypothetical protein